MYRALWYILVVSSLLCGGVQSVHAPTSKNYLRSRPKPVLYLRPRALQEGAADAAGPDAAGLQLISNHNRKLASPTAGTDSFAIVVFTNLGCRSADCGESCDDYDASASPASAAAVREDLMGFLVRYFGAVATQLGQGHEVFACTASDGVSGVRSLDELTSANVPPSLEESVAGAPPLVVLPLSRLTQYQPAVRRVLEAYGTERTRVVVHLQDPRDELVARYYDVGWWLQQGPGHGSGAGDAADRLAKARELIRQPLLAAGITGAPPLGVMAAVDSRSDSAPHASSQARSAPSEPHAGIVAASRDPLARDPLSAEDMSANDALVLEQVSHYVMSGLSREKGVLLRFLKTLKKLMCQSQGRGACTSEEAAKARNVLLTHHEDMVVSVVTFTQWNKRVLRFLGLQTEVTDRYGQLQASAITDELLRRMVPDLLLLTSTTPSHPAGEESVHHAKAVVLTTTSRLYQYVLPRELQLISEFVLRAVDDEVRALAGPGDGQGFFVLRHDAGVWEAGKGHGRPQP